uniref:Kringle domain-containing protein n=1 Tax=Romanomermis culicivorax TaxID=13658 RepID=A0A915IBK3_ROMCU
MGQREEPAFGDVSLINRIYCQESCFNKNELPNVNFNGNLTMTISGRTCQNWATQYPQKHRYTSLGNHESCRNPDKWAGGPWCYTKDPSVPYEPCFSSCEDLGRFGNTPRPVFLDVQRQTKFK